MSSQKLEKPRDIAKRFGLSVSFIQKLMRDGKIEYVNISPNRRMIPEGSFEKYIEENHYIPNKQGGRHGV